MLINIALVLLFILIGGIFAATEMALVSLRESQIRQLERGTGAAQTVARLARDSGLFLSAVQIGVTFAGFFSSAFGASTIAPQIAPYLVEAGLGETAASMSALVLMTILISYLSLVLGELVPKRIAMQKAQRVSLVVAPPLKVFATLMRPVIWIVDTSSAGILRLLGIDPDARTSAMTMEEVRDIVTSHEGIDERQREIVDDVFDAGERIVGEVMQHRSDTVAYQGDLTLGEVTADITGRPYSRYPVYGESMDDIIGFVHVRDLLEHQGRAAEPISRFVRNNLSFEARSVLEPAGVIVRSSSVRVTLLV